MKKYAFLFFVLFVCLNFFAQPDLHVEEERVVYEDFRFQPVLTHTFEIKNTGTEDLEILRARPT